MDADAAEVIGGDEFGGMVVASVRFFHELIRLKVGDPQSFHNTRDLAWKWILDNQLTENPARDN